MIIRVICIGDELLSGDTINTNLATLGELIAQHGLAIDSETCIPDERSAIVRALENAAASKPDVVLITGGLGPTVDDLTRPVTAEFLKRPLHVNAMLCERISTYLGERAKAMPDGAIAIQAQVPEGAEILDNHNGTASGLLMTEGPTTWILLPGPPRELLPMFTDSVLPRLCAMAPERKDALTVRICGLPESRVEAAALKALAGISDALHFAICIKADCIMLRLTMPASEDSRAILENAHAALKTAFGYRLMPLECTTATQYLARLLKERNLVMATAESCTGGGIAQMLTAIPGSSEWFVGGMVTYANEWKMKMLGVEANTLETYGAVSENTVREMLRGLREKCGVPAGVAVSGIAGPGGGTPDKPVGTVVVGAFAPDWEEVRTMHYNGKRDAVRARSASSCVNLLIEGLCR